MIVRRSHLLLCFLSGVPTLWALEPEDIGNKTLRLNMNESQVSRSELYQAPALPWYQLSNITDFVIDFPEKGEFAASVTYGGGLTNEVQVLYSATQEKKRATIRLGCDDFTVQVELTYTSDTAGTATIAWHEAGDTRHFRHVTFTMQDDFDVASRVELPEEIISTSPEYAWDDGLQDILKEIENTRYGSATEKLYQKRLVSLLPSIMILHDASWTSPDYKGNTALHYACSLGHVELVRWLVNHGADLECSTDKGVGIDACVGGKNGALIKNILQEARAWRDKPYTGPTIDAEDACEAAAWLDVEFSGYDMEKADYDITFNEKKVREMARLVYRYTKENQSMFSLGIDQTGTLAGHLIRVLNAKVSENMFEDWIVRDLKQSRMRMQVVRRGEGLSLATLPHMIKVREEEGMSYDGSTAIYRAAKEGKVELVRWLISHGADRTLTDPQGKPATLPPNTPNAAAIMEALRMRD